jgi:type IV secretory pathway TraG/TraD family ATPase VirD4
VLSIFRKRKKLLPKRWQQEMPIMALNEQDHWTIGDACQGTQIFGSTGSGKTTGSLAAIVGGFLKAGFGGLFLTVKPDDCATYVGWCKRHGRSGDVMVFSPSQPYRFNALDSELRRTDAGAGHTQSVVTLLSSMLELNQRNKRGSGAGGDDSYWQSTNQQLTRNSVDLLFLAKGRLSAVDLYRLVVAAPPSFEALRSEDWRKRSYCCQCLEEADAKTQDPVRRRDLELVADYFCCEWPGLSDRTRSVILSMFTSMLDVLNRGLIRELTSSTSNISPELAQEGAIIIVDLPVKLFGDTGIFVQAQWKYCMQRAQERRDVAKNPRPVFMVADESHLHAVKQDQVFQTTARSSHTAVVYATQSISNYLAAFGDHSESEVHSLLGNLQTQVFHQQADIKTNAYAADLIGRSRQYLFNTSNTSNQNNWLQSLLGRSNPTQNAGMSETFEYEVQPQAFADLRNGGAPSWCVDGILYQGGRQFSTTGRPWTPVTFKQQF